MTLTYAQVVAHAIENGGGTFRITKGGFTPDEREKGYYVSLSGGVENLPFLDAQTVRKVLAAWASNGHVSEYTRLGLWKDDSDNWSIDLTVWVYNPSSAEIVGRDNNQRAIWDITNAREITL